MNEYLTIFTLVIGSFLVQGFETVTPSESTESFELFHTPNSRVDDFEGIELLTPEMSNPVEGFPFSLLCQWHQQYFQNPSVVWRLTSPDKTTITDMNATYTPIQDIRINMNNDDASKLIWSNVPINANGSSFACTLDNTYSSPNYTMHVESHLLKTNVSANLNYIEKIYVDPGMTLSLICPVDATLLPRPQAEWTSLRGMMNDSLLVTLNNTDDASILSLDILPGFMADEFKCNFISNSTTNSTTTYTFRVRITNKPFTIWHNVGFIVAAIVFLILIGLLVRTIHFKMKQKKMTRIIRGKLLQGDPRKVNPDAPLEGHVALLPYDSKWEFPRNRLVLGKQLGTGQFHFVFEARALGTVQDLKDRAVRTVAVKLVKPSVDPTALVSLSSELKILIHLGPHLNVVNLLGACTKNIIEGELLVIKEFCRYGNLRDYLIANRKFFINELDDKGILKPSNSGNIRDRNLVLSSLPESSNNFSKKRCLNRTDSAAYYHNSMTSHDKSSKHLVYNMLGYKVPDKSPDEVMECRLTVDREDANLEPKKEIVISTRDLICWSIQIARGMEHLASKKVIHGDLAAHNILLAEGNVVKIANFGLPRQTKYNYDGNYLKKGQGETLSIKWMAMESLIDRIFSTESDIWSYGVVLWEMFSLGQIPYADITTLKNLIRFLKDGQRLEEPVFSPVLVGRLMTRCWEKKPGDRPSTFSEIEREFGNLLG